MRKLVTIFSLLISFSSFTQKELDSLWDVWSSQEATDTSKLRSLRLYIRKGYLFSEPEEAIKLTHVQFDYAKKVNYLYYMADALNTEGIANAIQSKFNIAIEKYMEALQYYEKDENKSGQASVLNNIGVLYSDLDEWDKSIEYYEKSLKVKEELGDSLGMASTLNNIGVILKGQERYAEALVYYEKCLEIETKAGREVDNCSTLNNMAVAYKLLDSLDKAEEYALRSLEISEKYDSKRDMAISYNVLSVIQMNTGQLQKAKTNAEKAKELALEISGTQEASDAYQNLHSIYRSLGDYRRALENYEQYIDLENEMKSAENQQEVIKQEFKYAYEKQAAADSVKNAEAQKVKDAQLLAQKAENRRQKQQSYYLYGGLILTLIFGGFILNRYRTTRRQKVIIEEQKRTVDKAFEKLAEQNTEILDSISYAQRIQGAILPSDKNWTTALSNSFVLYLPKDIVAGDFYWLEQKEEMVLFAAADCTGHGVPGAMVSVVCNNALNRSVHEYAITDPGKILDKTREIVIQEFEKSEEEVRDGMDIALCSLRMRKENEEKETHSDSASRSVLKYAGAHNPLWIIRKDGTEIEEIKANKQPIGKFDHHSAYQTHEVSLYPGDTIYLFSDGYADQFGGEHGKKLKSANFKELLLAIKDLSMADQKERLQQAFLDWKGNLEQIDDICIIGVRI